MILILGVAAAYASWRIYLHSNSITVVFTNAQGVKPDTGVWMDGIQIGRVLDLKIARDGVAIGIFLPADVRDQLTDKSLFVIDNREDKGTGPIIRVKNLSKSGNPLIAGMRLKGVDSFMVWQLSDFQEKVKKILNDPRVKEDLNQLRDLGGKVQK